MTAFLLLQLALAQEPKTILKGEHTVEGQVEAEGFTLSLKYQMGGVVLLQLGRAKEKVVARLSVGSADVDGVIAVLTQATEGRIAEGDLARFFSAHKTRKFLDIKTGELAALEELCGLKLSKSKSKFIPFPSDDYAGLYQKVHPSGRYVVTTRGNSSSLIDLQPEGGGPPRLIKTSMRPEGAPTGLDWRFIVSPLHRENGQRSMKFFLTSELIEKGENAKPPMVLWEGEKRPFEDRVHNNYYQSAGELPGGTARKKTYRVSLYNEQKYRDYVVRFDKQGRPTHVDPSPVKRLCAIPLSSPVLSLDGQYVAGNAKGNVTKIYRVDGIGKCTEVANLGFSTSKVQFDYPRKGKKGRVVFSATGLGDDGADPSEHTYIYDLDSGTTTRISAGRGARYRTSYPGFTLDGRVIARADITHRGQSYKGVEVMDPAAGVWRMSEADEERFQSLITGACFANPEEGKKAFLRMGQLWSEICRPGVAGVGVSYQEVAVSLDVDKCTQILKQARGKMTVLVPFRDLLAVCLSLRTQR